jgi:hypothetical protein
MQMHDRFYEGAAQRTVNSAANRYQTIDAVMTDPGLDAQQKRAILSSWASDLWAVESCPWLREVPGVRSPLRVSDIFAALRTLDGGPPPRGGASVRVLPLQTRTRTDARSRIGPSPRRRCS